jgi:pimeloyl-ACP methyl ester carboxylesterase
VPACLAQGLGVADLSGTSKGSVDLASHIAQAQLVELDGADHWAFAGDQQPVLASIRQFVGSLGA